MGARSFSVTSGVFMKTGTSATDVDYYEDLDPETVRAVLAALKRGEQPKAGSQTGRWSSEPKSGLTTLKDAQPKSGKKDS